MENTSKHPDSKRDLCHETTHEHSYALGVVADDGPEHWFGTAQFLDAELGPNPAVEEGANVPPERLHLRFATGEVVILGRGLRRLAQALQRGELERIHQIEPRYAGVPFTGPSVLSIVVTRNEEE